MAGSSSYPESKDNYVEKQDGIDIIQADDVNNPYAAIDALQTYLGVTGKTQANSVDLLDFFVNAGHPICTKASDTSISVSAGAVAVKNSGQTIRLPKRNSSSITVDAGKIDTGSMVIGFYYIYAVGDATATTFTILFSASASTPTGATNYELIGWFYNEANGSFNVASGFVGTLRRNGRGARNELTVYDATAFSTSSTSFQDIAPNDMKFYAPSQLIEIEVNFRLKMAANNEYGYCILEIDSSDVTDSQKMFQGGPAFASGDEQDMSLIWRGQIASPQCNIQVKGKTGHASYTLSIPSKYIKIREL